MDLGATCPDCDGRSLIKYGVTKTGRQKYQCLDCRRQFVAGSEHRIPAETKSAAERLLAQGVTPAQIAAAIPGISVRWLTELRRRMSR